MIKLRFKILLPGVLLCGSGLLWAQQESAGQTPGSTAPDNTKTNQRDRDQASPTSDQQSEQSADLELTRQIRQALVKDKSLSTYAHNIKIISQQGMVTLKGPVKSAEEKTEIETMAAEVAGGTDKIHSELEVASGKTDKPQ